MNCTTICRVRRLMALVMALVLALSLSAEALAADTASGTDLRLETTEGTVTAKNQNGRTVSVRDGMKLYSGYTITTKAKSYAYVSLDDDKVVKLDASTSVEVRKSGSKLELMVASGKLFFNVKAPLSSSESLNIRTSTMVTGIRGTSGYVELRSADSSAVTILDGTVTVSGSNGAQATVTAGQTGTATAEGGGLQMNIGDLSAADIPGFVAEELQNDPELQQRVGDATGLPVEDIAAGAQQRLEADEQQAQEAQNAIDQALPPDQVNHFPAFKTPTNPVNPGTPVNPDVPDEPDEPDEPGGEEPGGEEPGEPAVTDYTITGSATGADLQGYLDQYVTVTVASSGEVAIGTGESVTIPAGKSLTLESGGSFTNDGTLTNNGTITDGAAIINNSSGQINNYGNLTFNFVEGDSYAAPENNGAITNYAGGTMTTNTSLTNEGTIHNAGTLNINSNMNNWCTDSSSNVSLTNTGTITITSTLWNRRESGAPAPVITNGGTIALEGGTINNDGSLTNSGSITISGTSARLSNSGTLTVTSTGTITNNTADAGSNTAGINNSGTLTVAGTITNSGWMSNGNGDAASTFGTITIQNGGRITNNGTIRNYACSVSGSYNTIAIEAGGTLTSCTAASITNCGQITVSGTLTNDGDYIGSVTISNSTYTGTVTNKEGGTINGTTSNQITDSDGYTDETQSTP